MPSNWLMFDRIRALVKRNRIFQAERPLQDQSQLDRIIAGGEFFENGGQQSAILDQTNLQIGRLERYRDYELMDQTGEISLALDLYADEASLIDPEKKHTLIIRARNKRLKEELEDFLYNTLRWDTYCRPTVRYLCKFGCAPFEIVPDINRAGVSALRPISIYNFTRVETRYGDLVGFFHSDMIQQKPQFMHPWQVMHMRLTSFENMFNPYGKSIIEGGRKAYRQLRLMEDAALIHRLCLRGDSLVWTPDGHKPIKDIKIGDIVYSYTKDGSLKQTKVTKWACNGKDKIYRIASLHREIYANATHPILVEKSYANKRKSNRDIKLEYVDVKDIITKRNSIATHHRFILPDLEHHGYVKLKFPNIPSYARLKVPVTAPLKPTYKGKKAGIGNRKTLDLFFSGQKWLPTKTAKLLLQLSGIDADLEYRQAWCVSKYGCSEYNFPEIIDEKFARWFGFMIGDGYIREESSICKEVGMALGDDKSINQYYIDLFNSFVGESVNGPDDRSNADGKQYVYSKILHAFMILNGFIPGAHNKRIPGWVFKSPRSVQEAFIKGYIDADHTVKQCDSGLESYELDCCNEMLARDLKELCHRIGYDAGIVRSRTHDSRHIIGKHIVPSTIGWCLYFTANRKERNDICVRANTRHSNLSEAILSVEEVGEDLVYDITVEAEEHNFIVNGIPVHNTRSPERRKFTIPVGNIPPKEVPEYLQMIARGFKRGRFYNPTTGTFDERYSPLIQEDDYFLPRRPDGTGPEVDVMPGAENLDQIKDIEYFKKKMIAPTKIPFSRVGLGEGGGEASEKSLSQSHSEFAKAVQWVQREVATGITKVCIVHLALRGFPIQDLKGFEIALTATSAMEELYRIETWQTRVGVMIDLKDLGWFPKEWIVTNFTDLSPDEIEELKDMESEANSVGGGGGGGGGPLDIPDEASAEGEQPLGLGEPTQPVIEPTAPAPGTPQPSQPGLEGYDYDSERKLITEINMQRIKSKSMAMVEKWANRRGKNLYSEENQHYNGYTHMMESNELDGLNKSTKQNGDGIENIIDPNDDGSTILVEWSGDKQARLEAIKEVYDVIIEESNAIEVDDTEISESDLPPA